MSRAIVVRQTGGPEVMQFEEWPVAAPGPGQIRLRQTAIGLNFIDTYQRSGLYPVQTPFVAGNEGVGIVTAVGEGVDDIAVGDRVGYEGQTGAYAEERIIKAAKAVPIPEGIDDAVAAAVILKGFTAFYLLHKTFVVSPGDTILWHAAAGGVGLIAGQWAKGLGARVIGTVGSDEKIALAKANGCDEVINYNTEDFAKRVRELTDGQGVDVVYDGVGKATFEKSLDCLKPRGLMVSFGNASGPVSVPDLGILARKGSLYITRPTSGWYFSTRDELLEAADALFGAILTGFIRVSIGQTFKLADAVAAHQALESRGTTGSVVLLP